MPTLSVIIPVLNEERHIRGAILSAAVAAGPQAEILVVDDGSTDGTASAVQEVGSRHPGVRLLQHPGGTNRGVAASRNLGLAEARAPYVAFLDADDTCEPTRFTPCLGVLEGRPDLDGVLVPVRVVFETGSDAGARAFLPTVLGHESGIAPDDFARATLHGRSRFHISNCVVRASLFERSGVFNPRLALGEEDTDLWLRMALCGRFLAIHHGEPLVTYRRHATNRWRPAPADLYRDLRVVARVLRWARGSPHVSMSNRERLRTAFREKVLCALVQARDTSARRAGWSSAIVGWRTVPSLLADRAVLANVVRLLRPGTGGSLRPPAGSDEAAP
jgi:glycosyltransferase involved in cell wall biosynthesis